MWVENAMSGCLVAMSGEGRRWVRDGDGGGWCGLLSVDWLVGRRSPCRSDRLPTRSY
ncbi:hypothetical protein SAMN05444320_101914 [Streptoalloteichus hindustanus]|uniref:Uncharacterized protein n=1 Tax=Streptoalloteichus hindustanus TaxID=2017 RepID=A0A1M4VWY3_STRHI|nr:hypothetical protein SAMN05444320_101914 [Streptoalloteichus hindustanus]